MNTLPNADQILRERFPGLNEHEPLAPHAYFRVGGPARYFLHPANLDEYVAALKTAIDLRIPIVVIGAGANVLVSDRGWPGLVIRGGGKDCRRIDDELMIADAGVALGTLMNSAGQEGLTGLEFLAGIPGTVGGAIFGNAGGKDLAIGDRLERIKWMTLTGQARESTAEECSFGYRSSRFKQEGGYILQGIFRLKPGDPVQIRTAIEQTLQRKRANQPLANASAGCVFQNPAGRSAGQLIDEAGLKGKRIGGAEVSTVHGNFIINRGQATAEDIVILISYIKQQIRDQFDVQLIEEIRYIGFDHP